MTPPRPSGAPSAPHVPRLAVALETSGVPGSVAARRGDRTAERSLGPGSVHGKSLFPCLEECIVEVGGAPEEIDLVVVGTGPGSYTGLRVGIAAAKALSFARRCAVLGLPSARAIAAAAAADLEVLVAIDAHRGEIYLSRHGPPRGRILLDPRLAAPEEIPHHAGRARRILGGGAILHRDRILSIGFEVGGEAAPRASVLLAIGWDERDLAAPPPGDAVRPLYLRASAAEEKRSGSPRTEASGGRPDRPPPASSGSRMR